VPHRRHPRGGPRPGPQDLLQHIPQQQQRRQSALREACACAGAGHCVCARGGGHHGHACADGVDHRYDGHV